MRWRAEGVRPKGKAGARPSLSKQIGRKSWNSRCSHSSDDGGSPSGNALQQSPHKPRNAPHTGNPTATEDQRPRRYGAMALGHLSAAASARSLHGPSAANATPTPNPR